MGDALLSPVVVGVVSLLLAWLFGNTLLARFEREKKLTERDIAALDTFHAIYGEFFATWKEWEDSEKTEDLAARSLKRAADVEGKYEALLVMICGSRPLDDHEKDVLGSLRQAIQQLREAVKGREDLPWWSSDWDEYLAFKHLTAAAAHLLQPRTIGWAGRPPPRPAAEAVAASLTAVTANVYESTWRNVARGSVASTET